ncbi:helix-turn-helix domain-containing protein [Saccharicrinis sp. FJH2]|uniref:helix-turn-helix domain-containing protein n=1 Tax=Saccharicrinis sp. FJH65 TaxID=3344659 RepID=UPI0035F3E62E
MVTPLSTEHTIPDGLKDVIIQITSTQFTTNGETLEDKFIPNCCTGWVIHFKKTFTLSGANLSPFILPTTFFIGNINHFLFLRSLGDSDSIVIICKPYGLYRIFGINMGYISQNYCVDAMPFITRDFYDLIKNCSTTTQRINLLTGYIEQKLQTSHKPPHIVDSICDELTAHNGNIKIQELAARYNLNERYLRRLFKERIGLSAKQLARIARISYMIRNLPVKTKPEWLSLVNECGYSDQAHLINDFKAVTGETPNTLFNRDRRYMNFITFLKQDEITFP